MKKIEVYFKENIKNNEYVKLIDFAIKNSDCFSLSSYTRNNQEVDFIKDYIKDKIIIENIYDNESISDYYEYFIIGISDFTINYLKQRNSIFDFYSLQDLKFYKQGKCWFCSISHENMFSMVIDENDIDEAKKINGKVIISDGIYSKFDTLDNLVKP